MRESCSSCKFWNVDGQGPITTDDNDDQLHENDYWAQCSRFPPVMNARLTVDIDYLPDQWEKPLTAATNWCGEWRPVA